MSLEVNIPGGNGFPILALLFEHERGLPLRIGNRRILAKSSCARNHGQ
jgi:hypothetical protein